MKTTRRLITLTTLILPIAILTSSCDLFSQTATAPEGKYQMKSFTLQNIGMSYSPSLSSYSLDFTGDDAVSFCLVDVKGMPGNYIIGDKIVTDGTYAMDGNKIILKDAGGSELRNYVVTKTGGTIKVEQRYSYTSDQGILLYTSTFRI